MTSVVPSESSVEDERAEVVARGLVRVLIAEQLLIAAVGVLGAVDLNYAATLLRGLEAALLIIDVTGLAVLLRRSSRTVHGPVLLVWALITLTCVWTAKLIAGANLSDSAVDGIRLLSPIGWIVVCSQAGVFRSFEEALVRRRRLVAVLLAVQMALLAVARLRGSASSYLAGDPVVGLLVYPLIVRRDEEGRGAHLGVLTAGLVLLSLKRTAWVAAVVAVGVLLVRDVTRLRFRRPMKVALVLALAIVGLAIAGWTSEIQDRFESSTLSFATTAGASGADQSVAQRNEEVSLQFDRMRANPIGGTVWGLSSEDLNLSNGLVTHAIHNTYVFVLTSGGLVWVVALLAAAPGVADERPSFALVIGALVCVVDAVGGNSALAPSLGISLAVLLALWRQRRTVP